MHPPNRLPPLAVRPCSSPLPPLFSRQDTELGNSWVAGMAEIPLTLEQKLANIEATEAAKKQMLSIVPGE